MDVEVKETTEDSEKRKIFDLVVTGGKVPFITGNKAIAQRAGLIAFLQKGLCPQLPDDGVPWLEYFTGQRPIGEVDLAIRQRLLVAGLSDFSLFYENRNGQTYLQIQKNPKIEGTI